MVDIQGEHKANLTEGDDTYDTDDIAKGRPQAGTTTFTEALQARTVQQLEALLKHLNHQIYPTTACRDEVASLLTDLRTLSVPDAGVPQDVQQAILLADPLVSHSAGVKTSLGGNSSVSAGPSQPSIDVQDVPPNISTAASDGVPDLFNLCIIKLLKMTLKLWRRIEACLLVTMLAVLVLVFFFSQLCFQNVLFISSTLTFCLQKEGEFVDVLTPKTLFFETTIICWD